jgi:PAS domain S-box-containing protein
MKNKLPQHNSASVPVISHLHQLAFGNSFLPNIISIVASGRIIEANLAAGKLLGYSHKGLLKKNLEDIFINDDHHYTELLEQRGIAGHAVGNLTALKKNGKSIPCQTTSVVFIGDNHIQKAITTLVNRSETIHQQKVIDLIQEKRFATVKRLARSDSAAALHRVDDLEHQLDEEISTKEFQIARAVISAKEVERSDLGKELHDNVNQLLAASRMFMDMARRNKGKRDTYLSQSSEYTLTAIEEIRKLCKGLITDVVINLGLCDAVKHLTSDIMEAHPIKISCRMDKDIHPRMHAKFNLNIFRIVQEQLNNIIKHAKASIVIISLSRQKDKIVLSVGDNGTGFDITRKVKGIGIRNIKSRAAFYQGIAHFDSKKGKGCVLRVSFPATEPVLNKTKLLNGTALRG